jgi:phage regulator Rha-like protein
MKEISIYNGTQMMTSLEIAEVTGKNHFDVLRAIRKMELAWQKVTDSKFAVSE